MTSLATGTPSVGPRVSPASPHSAPYRLQRSKLSPGSKGFSSGCSFDDPPANHLLANDIHGLLAARHAPCICFHQTRHREPCLALHGSSNSSSTALGCAWGSPLRGVRKQERTEGGRTRIAVPNLQDKQILCSGVFEPPGKLHRNPRLRSKANFSVNDLDTLSDGSCYTTNCEYNAQCALGYHAVRNQPCYSETVHPSWRILRCCREQRNVDGYLRGFNSWRGHIEVGYVLWPLLGGGLL